MKDRKGPFSRDGKSALNDLLDFGPDTEIPAGTLPSADFTERIKQIVKKLQEINRRIDELTSR